MELNENRVHMSKYRLEMAFQYLHTAKSNFADGDNHSAANRAYYAIFQAIRAILVLDEADFKKHSAVISKFREMYVKTGVFDVRFSNAIGKAFHIRQQSDYDDFYLLSKEEITEQIANAEDFVSAVEQYLQIRFAKAAE